MFPGRKAMPWMAWLEDSDPTWTVHVLADSSPPATAAALTAGALTVNGNTSAAMKAMRTRSKRGAWGDSARRVMGLIPFWGWRIAAGKPAHLVRRRRFPRRRFAPAWTASAA